MAGERMTRDGRTARALRSAWTFFQGARMTAILIALLLCLFLTGLLIPQKALFLSRAEFDAWHADHPLLSSVVNAFQLQEIYTAPVTFVALTLFFLNLVVVIVNRVPIVFRKAYLGGRTAPAPANGDPGALAVQTGGNGVKALAATRQYFRRRFWTVFDDPSGRSFLAVRNRYSPFGFLLFHLSFLFCLAGGLLVMYTRFAGTIVLTEGQEFTADMAQFSSIRQEPKVLKGFPAVGLRLRKVAPRYERGRPTDLEAALDVLYQGRSDTAVVKVNEPIRRGAFSFLASDIGVSPLFLLRDAEGRELSGGYFSLKVLKGGEDSFEFPGRPERFFVRFYADHVIEEGKDRTRSEELRNPAVRLRIERDGAILADGLLHPGETIRFGRHVVAFGEVRYWIEVLMTREYGDYALYTGFLAGAAGLIMRLVFYQKSVRVSVKEGTGGAVMRISGNSEHYRYGFQEELAGIAEDLAREVAVQGSGEGA